MHPKFKDFQSLILYEDPDYLVINKPAHITTLANSVRPGQDILSLAKNYCRTAQVGHRLDKETSGVLAIAKNTAAYKHLCLQFEKRTVTKVYHALVEGMHHFDRCTVEAPILVSSNNQARINFIQGKPSSTLFQTLEVYHGYTLIECFPKTGRTHQIRVHAKFNKAPLVGDTQYGGKLFYLSSIKRKYQQKSNEEEQPLMKRVALHAYQLSFKGLDQSSIEVTAPYPKDLKAVLRQLEKWQ